MIARNFDAVPLTLSVFQVEELAMVLRLYMDDCGVPKDDDSEPLSLILRALRESLDAVPFISFGVQS